MSTPATPLLVTGASGHLGRRVVELLLERGVRAGSLIATTRNPAGLADLAARGVDVRRADYDDPTTLPAAFAGAARALLISTDALDRPGRRTAQHRAAIAALAAAGVGHVVYTSLPNPVGSLAAVAADHAATEAALADSALDYTILRNSLYTDFLLFSAPAAVASGQLVDARGDSAIAYVTREDCARAAAGALAATTTGRHTLDVTGPDAVTSAALAAILGELTGRAVAHVSVPDAGLRAGLAAHGVPPAMIEVLATFDAAAVRGDYAATAPTVHELGGAAPTSVRAFLAAHRAALTPAAPAA